MGDHFVLLVDRLLTESTLEAAIESGNQAMIGVTLESQEDFEADLTLLKKKNGGDGTFTGKLVECRICQDEDEDFNMETPCSCCGSLKYAHRKCVQRWCNEKGDTMCEICLQQFQPGYTAPPQLFHYGNIPMNFRGNWEISRRDIHDHRFITMAPVQRDLMNPGYDVFAASNARSTMYCRSVAVVFMVLLLLRHTLPIILTGAEQYSFALFTVLVLRTAGIVLPLYVMLTAVTTFHRRRQQQEIQVQSVATTEGTNMQSQSLQPMHPQPHLIHVH